MNDEKALVRQYKHNIRESYQEGNLTSAQICRLHAIGFFPEIPPSHYEAVVCYETGEAFPSVSAAAERYGLCNNSIYAAVNRGYSVGGYHWYYKSKGRPSASELKEDKLKKIECVETGEVFGSITEAANRYGVTQGIISRAVERNCAVRGRYHFRLVSNSKVKTAKEKRKMFRQVVNLETGEVFDSVKDAAETTGYKTGSFYPALRCTARTVGGHHWMYGDEYDLLSEEEIERIVKHGKEA